MVRAARLSDPSVICSNYGAKGGLAKSADAQRQAFARPPKATLAEGMVKQDYWDGADWLWREDE
jgi:hypothetical protein